MKVYIKNMMCRGAKLMIIQVLEKLGFSYNTIDLGMIEFKKDLSLKEIKELNLALNEYGLEVTFRDIRLVTEIRCFIHDLVDHHIQLWNGFSNYITVKFGYNYAYLNICFRLETGLPIENYYIEKWNEVGEKVVDQIRKSWPDRNK